MDSHHDHVTARSGPWVPGQGLVFRALLVARLLSAFFMHISDCDEVYNYWEPVSFHSILQNCSSFRVL